MHIWPCYAVKTVVKFLHSLCGPGPSGYPKP